MSVNAVTVRTAFTVHNPGLINDPACAKNRHFGIIDHRGRTNHAEDIIVVEDESPAPKLCRSGFSLASNIRQPADLRIQLTEANFLARLMEGTISPRRLAVNPRLIRSKEKISSDPSAEVSTPGIQFRVFLQPRCYRPSDECEQAWP